jgi:hypothetical protein
MSELVRRLALEYRPLWVGLGILALAALDLADPALVTGLGVLIVSLAGEGEA